MRSADISDDKLYRYALERYWSDESLPVAVFVMLNPSTADATTDDATITKCVGFAERWGCGGLHVVNLSPFRSTDPDQMVDRLEPGDVNARNSRALRIAFDVAASSCGPVVVAWGTNVERATRLQTRVTMVQAIARGAGVPLQSLGTTKAGHPRHPGRIGYDTPLEDWPPLPPGRERRRPTPRNDPQTPLSGAVAPEPAPSAPTHREGVRRSQGDTGVVHRCQLSATSSKPCSTPTSRGRATSLYVLADGRRSCAEHLPTAERKRPLTSCTHGMVTGGRCSFCLGDVT